MGVFGDTYSLNSGVIQEQKRQAGVAVDREKDREARLKYGRALVNALFNGGTYSGIASPGRGYNKAKTYYDAKGNVWKPLEQHPYTINQQYRDAIKNNNLFMNKDLTIKSPGRGYNKDKTYWDKNGNVWLPVGLHAEEIDEQYRKALADKNLFMNKGGSFEGLGDDFYEGYRDAVLDAQLPDLNKQYGKAKSQDLFSMVRQGIGRSTAATNRATERLAERDKNEINIKTGAENKVDALEADVDAARRKTLALLESTEDPSRAMTEGITEVNAISNTQPDLQPLGELFAAAAQGYQSYQNTRQMRNLTNLYNLKLPSTSSGRTY